MWRLERETQGTSDPKPCRYDLLKPECKGTDCRACLKEKMFNPNLCVTCGKDAYEEFRLTGKPHVCK